MTTEGASELDSKVKKLLLTRLSLESETLCPPCLITAYMKYVADLQYTKILEADAAVLRRMLRTGPLVDDFVLLKISWRAFEITFYNVDECPSLQ
ncbi:hypothetical protein HPB50_018790 [Hyalomma asiaticum]|uniref:Uncharacterized protein n=1 Tax=Hyalomma asiaticum TaxID=266040 RepID=A0ACB7RJY3_HYAAI|nr:hypothetical protein HPB50_018790 [Hyalomma asiaticum]